MQKRALLLPICVLVGALVFGGCGDDGGTPTGGDGNGATDTTPPAIDSVTAVDGSHVDVEFDEAVLRASAERPDNYTIVEAAAPSPVAGVAPDDTTWVGTAALDDDGKTVHLTTQSSMQDANYNLSVTGVEDTKGNRIDEAASSSFPGNDNPDQTPPEIVFRLPHSGETNVGVGQPVVVQFSEPMDYASVLDAFSWTGGGGPVLYGVDDSDGNLFVFFPLQTLQNNTTYNVMIAGTAQDWAGNSLVSILWSYTTTPTPDATPPTLSSSTPSNGATGVDVGANLVLTFSEPVLKRSLEQVQITPAIGDGIRVWSNDGRTVTIDPDEDMLPDTQYTLLIPPGGLRDLAGNGNVDAIHVVWSTGTTW